MVRLLEYSFIFYFLISLIPSLRNKLKASLRQFFITLGAMFLIVSSIMTFYVYPRLLNLYQQSGMITEPQKWTTYLTIGIIISVSIIFYGVKAKNLNKLSNIAFYTNYGILLILAIVFLELVVSSIILPINNLTSTFK